MKLNFNRKQFRMSKETKKNYVVAQHNELLEATYSSKLTARAHKVARLILALINPLEENLREYTIKIEDLKQYLGYQKKNVTWGRFYDDLRDIALRLNSEPIILQTGKKKQLTAFFISSYEIDTLEGKVTFEISGKLKPYLLQLKKNYTTYLLANIPRLRSAYSIRIYELLYQYKKIGKRYFELDDLQKKVGSNHKLYGNFKNRVLKIAERDLKENTDIRFEYDEIKKGRKITGLQFYIFSQKAEKELVKQGVLSFLEDEITSQPELSERIHTTLKDLGIKESGIKKLLRQGFDIIANEENRKEALKRCNSLEIYYIEKLTLLEQSKVNGGSNPAGFLIKALQEDWRNSKKVDKKVNKQILKEDEKTKLENKIAQLQRQKSALQKEWSKAKAPIINAILKDEQLFLEIYEQVMGKMGNISRSLVNSAQTPREQYLDSSMLHNLMNLETCNRFPNKFVEIENQYKKQIDILNAKLKT